MRFYKFYHVDSPNSPDLSNLKGELLHALGGVKASSCLLGVPLGHYSSFLQGPAFAPPRIREAIWCGSTNSSTGTGKDLKDPRILTDVGDVPVQEIRDCDVDDDGLMNVISESVKLVMEEEKLKQAVDTTGDAMTQEEILLDVLGPRSGYIRGKGTAVRFYAKGVKQLATQKIVEQQHGIIKEQHQEIQDLKKKMEESHERQ